MVKLPKLVQITVKAAQKYNQRSGLNVEWTQITALQFALNRNWLQQSNVGGVTHETKWWRNIVTNAKAKSGLGTRPWEKSEKGSGR